MGIYFSIASFMFVVFFILIIGVPLVMYAKSRIDDAIDNTVDSWDENPYLVFIDNLYDSFKNYQAYMIDQFDQMTREFNFHVVDANLSINRTHQEVMQHIQPILDEYNN